MVDVDEIEDSGSETEDTGSVSSRQQSSDYAIQVDSTVHGNIYFIIPTKQEKVGLSVCLSVCLFCLFCLSVCLSVLSVCLSVCSVCLSVLFCLSVCSVLFCLLSVYSLCLCLSILFVDDLNIFVLFQDTWLYHFGVASGLPITQTGTDTEKLIGSLMRVDGSPGRDNSCLS